jgi:chemotaxis protein MotB
MQGGAKVQAPVGDNELVKMVRPGRKTGVGTVLYFQEEQIDLDDEQRSILRQQADLLHGKPQKLEIRGHTSVRPLAGEGRYRDNWDISYERCRQVMRFLVEDLGIDSHRLRISAAAANEPLYAGTDTAKLERNPRVEVYLLDEVVRETMGSEEEQDARFVPDKSATKTGDNPPPAIP